MNHYQITDYCHHFMEDHVKEGDFCIDATAGNGNDTLFLCKLVGNSGKVLAFDIQEAAVNTTNERIFQEGYSDTAAAVLDSHVNMHLYAEENSVDLIVFNFGYLPGGDHALATNADTSIPAIETALRLLKKRGILSLCIYSGKDSGYEEKDALLPYLKALDPHKYIVILSSYYNRPNDPPIPVLVVKL